MIFIDDDKTQDMKLMELVTLDKGIEKEIRKSVDMGFDKIQIGLITPKKKGVMLMNRNYEVRGVYPIEYQKIIQSIIDNQKTK